jgi:hypothetical protein
VGIAAARGIALVTGKPAVGLSSLAAHAAPHMAAGETRSVVVAIDVPAAAPWSRRGSPRSAMRRAPPRPHRR